MAALSIHNQFTIAAVPKGGPVTAPPGIADDNGIVGHIAELGAACCCRCRRRSGCLRDNHAGRYQGEHAKGEQARKPIAARQCQRVEAGKRRNNAVSVTYPADNPAG